MARIFTRAEFHELVWARPMTHLAKEFGLSDVALHKICRKHAIPTPPARWWARKAAGKTALSTPLPAGDDSARVRIVSSDLGLGDPRLAAIREEARVRAASIAAPQAARPPVIDKTIARLRKAPAPKGGALVSAGGSGLIACSIAPESIDRLEIILVNLVAAAGTQGFSLEPTEAGVCFKGEDGSINFSITEVVARTKHVLTDAEAAKLDAWEKKQAAKRLRDPWHYAFDRPKFEEWDYAATGRLKLEFETLYVANGRSPRRSFSDAKTQRLEDMAGEIAVGLVVLAAAKAEEGRRREAWRREREEAEHRRREALRTQHVRKRRGAAMDEILAKLSELRLLRNLMVGISDEAGATGDFPRVAEFLRWSEEELARREAALDARGLEARFVDQALFGEDDDRDFRPPYY